MRAQNFCVDLTRGDQPQPKFTTSEQAPLPTFAFILQLGIPSLLCGLGRMCDWLHLLVQNSTWKLADVNLPKHGARLV